LPKLIVRFWGSFSR